jgi:helicase MOV-10
MEGLYTLDFFFKPTHEGRFQEVLELAFHDENKGVEFVITRKLVAIVGCRADHETLKAKRPYVKRRFIPVPEGLPFIRTTRPPFWTPTPWKQKLPLFPAPKALTKVLSKPHVTEHSVRGFLPVFNEESYGRYFSVLVHVETDQRRSVFPVHMSSLNIGDRSSSFMFSRELEEYSMQNETLVPDPPRYL